MGPSAPVDPDRLLLNWSHPRVIPVGDAELAVHLGGAGQPVLILPGFPNSPRAFMPIAEALARDHSVILPYLPGSGPSRPPATGGQSIVANARRVWTLCEHLGVRDLQVVGHDFGGGIAYWLALHHQLRIRRMVVISTPLRGATFRHVLQGMRLSCPIVADLLFTFAGPAIVKRMYELWGGPDFTLRPEELEHAIATWTPPGKRRAALPFYRALGNVRAMNKFRTAWIKVPTMLIFGDSVRVIPRTTIELTAEAIDKVKVKVLKGVGHFPHMERPEEVTELITGFLSAGSRKRDPTDSVSPPVR